MNYGNKSWRSKDKDKPFAIIYGWPEIICKVKQSRRFTDEYSVYVKCVYWNGIWDKEVRGFSA